MHGGVRNGLRKCDCDTAAAIADCAMFICVFIVSMLAVMLLLFSVFLMMYLGHPIPHNTIYDIAHH